MEPLVGELSRGESVGAGHGVVDRLRVGDFSDDQAYAYRQAWAEVGHPADKADIAVAVHGFVAADDRQAKATYLGHEMRMFATGAAEVGRPPMAPSGREANYEPGGMVFAGGPNEIADRILHLHQLLGHSRQILQIDVGGLSHATFLKSIELLGTEVLPQIRKELGQP